MIQKKEIKKPVMCYLTQDEIDVLRRYQALVGATTRNSAVRYIIKRVIRPILEEATAPERMPRF